MGIGLSWRRARWALSVTAIAALAWIDPEARPWIVGSAVLAGLATIVAKSARRAANESRHEYSYGSVEATPSTVTFTRYGKSQSIRWDEIESVAYGEDPLTQEPEWWLRGHGHADRLKSILRRHLLHRPNVPRDETFRT
jgi:hypothetical protein